MLGHTHWASPACVISHRAKNLAQLASKHATRKKNDKKGKKFVQGNGKIVHFLLTNTVKRFIFYKNCPHSEFPGTFLKGGCQGGSFNSIIRISRIIACHNSLNVIDCSVAFTKHPLSPG